MSWVVRTAISATIVLPNKTSKEAAFDAMKVLLYSFTAKRRTTRGCTFLPLLYHNNSLSPDPLEIQNISMFAFGWPVSDLPHEPMILNELIRHQSTMSTLLRLLLKMIKFTALYFSDALSSVASEWRCRHDATYSRVFDKDDIALMKLVSLIRPLRKIRRIRNERLRQ